MRVYSKPEPGNVTAGQDGKPLVLSDQDVYKRQVLEQDVSGHVHDVPVVGHVGDVHLVLNFDYEVPSEPGSDGAG